MKYHDLAYRLTVDSLSKCTQKTTLMGSARQLGKAIGIHEDYKEAIRAKPTVPTSQEKSGTMPVYKETIHAKSACQCNANKATDEVIAITSEHECNATVCQSTEKNAKTANIDIISVSTIAMKTTKQPTR
eukprot:376769-Amphidinium_carterae.1